MKTTINLTCGCIGALLATMPVGGADGISNTNTISVTASSRETLSGVERASRIIGRDVRDQINQRIGRIEDFAVDLESGRIIFAVVSVGGFLGVGDRTVAVPVSAFDERGRQFRLNDGKERLDGAPEISGDNAKQQFTPAFARSVNKHFEREPALREGAFEDFTATFGNAHLAGALAGMDVRSVPNEKIGRVDSVILDLEAGRVPYVIVDPDESLDLKENLFAVPPGLLKTASDGEGLTASIDRNQLASAPHFKKNDWLKLSDWPWGASIYKYYGQLPYFHGDSLQPTGTNSLERIYHEPEKTDP